MKCLQYFPLLLAASPGLATFVVQCTSRLVDDRLDPIIDPGEISQHVHVIAGGSGFSDAMDYKMARASSCTTCNIKQDLSNYWTPKLYYQAQNSSLISVPIDGDDSLGNMGGMAIYYLPRRGPDNDQLIPFPEGFRMFAGDPMKRAETNDFAGQAIRHRCVGGEGEFTSLPDKKCPKGVRTEVVFPSCWDGKNLDSPDHKSHVSYPKDGNYDGGRCPDSHPKHLLTLFYEVTYRTDMFEWYSDKQPFVFSNGDPTGYSYHGDFVNGWDAAKLAEAIENCPDGSHDCDPGGSVFDFNTPDDRQACKLPQRVVERVSGVLNALPGCNPVTTKPVEMTNCARNPQRILSISDSSGVADLTETKKWKYIGCGVDDPQAWGTRALSGSQQNGLNPMTIEKCVDACAAAGYTYAGLEFASECYCGKQLDQRAAPKAGILGNCNMKCTGDNTLNCGGSKAISIYQKCDAGACVNPGSGGDTTPAVPQVPANPVLSKTSATVVAPGRTSFSSSTSKTSSKSLNDAPSQSPIISKQAGASIQTTLATVTKAPIPSSSHIKVLKTRTKTETYTYLVKETYWE